VISLNRYNKLILKWRHVFFEQDLNSNMIFKSDSEPFASCVPSAIKNSCLTMVKTKLLFKKMRFYIYAPFIMTLQIDGGTYFRELTSRPNDRQVLSVGRFPQLQELHVLRYMGCVAWCFKPFLVT
jgi:hypothetical protein